MIFRLPYGGNSVALDLRGLKIRALVPAYSRIRSGAIGDRLVDAVEDPVEGPALSKLASGKRKAALVVPDATRKAALPEILPGLIVKLREFGIREIEILIACGTHPPTDDQGLRRILGEVPEDISIHQHDSRNPEGLYDAGTLPGGHRIRLNRHLLDAELVITVGAVRHHYFAGFGGGPKMIFPGLGGYEGIQRNHARVLKITEGGVERHPECEPGRLEGNPVAEEIAMAADLRPPDMAICLVPGPGGEMGEVFAGPWRASFHKAAGGVRKTFELQSPVFDLMIASGGGTPSDSTLIQAHKGLDAACRFLKPGGQLLYLASLEKGAGSEDMLPFLDDPRPETILRSLSGRWVQYGHTTLRILEKTRSNRVFLLSEMERKITKRLGFETVHSAEDLLEQWRRDFPGATVGLMSDAAVYPA